MIIAWFSLVFLLLVAMILYLFFYTRWRRSRVAARPFPAHWSILLQQHMALYRSLPADLKERLQRLILIFLDEKRFYGCDGLILTEPMRLIIAAHACLLVLGRGIHHYDRLRSILVYPSLYRAQEEIYDLGGVYSSQASTRLGESWHEGRVILSWNDVLVDAQGDRPDGNVAVHEFAHQLDQVNGAADGLPELAYSQSVQEWSRVLEREFEALRTQPGTTINPVIHEYGAENPAEFFAVATESFFTRPAELKRLRPELYKQLQDYYQLEPTEWAPT